MKEARFFWKSTCTTCRDARSFLRNDLKVDFEDRDYAKSPLTAAELNDLFKGSDPRDFLNPRSPAFKAMGLAGKTLSREQAIDLIVKESNLLKRPLTVIGDEMIAGFDRDRLRQAFK